MKQEYLYGINIISTSGCHCDCFIYHLLLNDNLRLHLWRARDKKVIALSTLHFKASVEQQKEKDKDSFSDNDLCALTRRSNPFTSAGERSVLVLSCSLRLKPQINDIDS